MGLLPQKIIPKEVHGRGALLEHATQAFLQLQVRLEGIQGHPFLSQ
jgi:hypothetical protein